MFEHTPAGVPSVRAAILGQRALGRYPTGTTRRNCSISVFEILEAAMGSP